MYNYNASLIQLEFTDQHNAFFECNYYVSVNLDYILHKNHQFKSFPISYKISIQLPPSSCYISHIYRFGLSHLLTPFPYITKNTWLKLTLSP